MNLIKHLKSIFRCNSRQKIQSFTYFIPAPKQFNQAYREKHFDKLFYEMVNQGYQIISVNTQSCQSSKGSGFWVFCILKAKGSHSRDLDFEAMFSDDEHLQNESKTINQAEDNDDFQIIPD